MKYNENKITKHLGLLYKAKHYLKKRSLLVLYYSFIHTYISYENIALRNNNRTSLKKSTVLKNQSTPSGSYIVKTDSHMSESYFEKARF